MAIISGMFTIFCTLMLPICATVYLLSREKRILKPILLGAATFFVFQILIRIPLIQIVLPNIPWYLKLGSTQPFMYALFLGITAALVEELGRYIVMIVCLKKDICVLDGIGFGIGHGGIEAILLVGVNALITIILARQSIVPSLMFASGVERVATIAIHIAWSIMVIKCLCEKKIRWLFLALFTHAVIDSAVSYVAILGGAVWVIEGVILICAIFAVLFVMNERKRSKFK